jgi:hypothetical protein
LFLGGIYVTERAYQAKIIKKLKVMLPGCVLLKNDAAYQQGIPDWTLLFKDRWAALEIKASGNSSRQPNQEYFVDKMNAMSFAAFVCPENEAEVLIALQVALKR